MNNNNQENQTSWKELHCRDCEHFTYAGDHCYCLWHETGVLPHFKSCEAFSLKDGEDNE